MSFPVLFAPDAQQFESMTNQIRKWLNIKPGRESSSFGFGKKLGSATSKLRKLFKRSPARNDPDATVCSLCNLGLERSQLCMLIWLDPYTPSSMIAVSRDDHAILPKTWIRGNKPIINLQLYTQVKVMQMLIARIFDRFLNGPTEEIIAWWASRLNLAGVTIEEFNRICVSYNYMLRQYPNETAAYPKLNENKGFVFENDGLFE